MGDKHYLAVETKPNNYFPINLSDLSISGAFNSDNLEELDLFTSRFTKKEIIKSIQNANLLEIDDIKNLVLIYKEKNVIRKIDVLTKEKNYNMRKLIEVNYHDKTFINKIYNFLNNKITKEEMSKIKTCQTLKEFLDCLSHIPYKIQRKLYFYLSEFNI